MTLVMLLSWVSWVREGRALRVWGAGRVQPGRDAGLLSCFMVS
jgi:hypothetical protein